MNRKTNQIPAQAMQCLYTRVLLAHTTDHAPAEQIQNKNFTF